MSDIVERLRAWVYTDSQYATAREAADAIERLRAEISRLSELAVDRRREIEMLCKVFWQNNLTDEERSAVEYYVGTGGPDSVDATLVALLSRSGSSATKTSDDAVECHSQREKLPERDRLSPPAT